MSQQESGNWKPYNVKAIVDNVALVMRTGDIHRLNKPAYDFINQQMGFIAHYDLGGFRSVYEDIDEFREKLQTSEHSRDTNYNDLWAIKCENDPQFIEWYGAAYCKSKADAIRGILAVARNQGTQMPLLIPAGELHQERR